LDLSVGFGLYLVQVADSIAADASRLAIALGEETFGDLPPFTAHPIVDLWPHAFIVVDPLEPDIEELDAEHSDLAGGLGKNLLLDQVASFHDRQQRADVRCE